MDNAMSQYQLPVFTIPSTRQILKEYNEQIVEMGGGGSSMEANELSPMPDYGIDGEEVVTTKIDVNYQKEWDVDSKGNTYAVNEISPSKAFDICRELDVNLQKESTKGDDMDVPLERVVIEVEDEILQSDIGTKTPNFFLEFTSVPITDDDKRDKYYRDDFEKFDLLNLNFNFRALALKSITSEERWFNQEDPNLTWGGMADVNLPYDATLSNHIQTTHMIDEFSRLADLEKVTEQKFRI